MEFLTIFIIILGLFVAGLIMLRPMVGLILMILYISVAVFPTVFSSFFGIFTQLSAIKLIGGLTFISTLIHNIIEKRHLALLQSRQSKFYLVFLLWVFISGFTQPCSFTHEMLTRYISFAMFFYIVISLINSQARLRMALWSCILTMLSASCLALFQHFSAEQAVRARSTFLDSNYFNLYLLPIIPVAFYRIIDEHSLILKIIAAVASIILILAVVFTFSRGGMIGLVVVLLLLALNSKRKLLAFSIIAIIATVFIINMPDYFRDRIEKTGIELQEAKTHTSTYRRMLLVEAGWKIFMDNPLTGVGVGNFYWTAGKYEPVYPGFAHNMYIEVAAELGLVGIFLFMGIIFLTLKDLRMIIKRTDLNLGNYAKGLYIGLMGFLAAALFLHAEYEKFLWLFIFLTISLRKFALHNMETVI